MKPHTVYIKELQETHTMPAPNIFDAATFVLGEQWPDWIRAVCEVEVYGEKYRFVAARDGAEIIFEFGS